MNGVLPLLLAALVQIATVPDVQPSIDFHFTSDAILEQGLAAATAEWTAQCVAGGELAAVTDTYAPDPGMVADERTAQMAKFDRNEFVRIATEAWRTANAALPQGSIRVCVDVARTSDTFTGDVMGGVTAVTAGQGRLILRIRPGADWKTVLPYVLAHEMHHSYWLQQHYDRGRPFTLADYLVLEGRADYFARSLFAHPAPWTAALDAADYATMARALAKDLNTVE
jgi:hypothetical protein